jgi:phosphoserine phosphatase RsbU/P
MKALDLSANSRISDMMSLMQALGECRTPYEALLRYTKYLDQEFRARVHVVLSTRGLPAGQYRTWRIRTDDGVDRVKLDDPWKGIHPPAYSGGILGEVVRNRKPQILYELDWRDDPNLSELLEPYHSLMALPLTSERLPLNWNIAMHRDAQHFTAADLEEAMARASLVASFLDSLRVGNELADAHAHIDMEIERMATIQRSLLPDPLPVIPGLDLAASYETFAQVGGDLYDLFSLDAGGGRWCIFLGDASGHGPAAAVVAAIVTATLRACAVGCAGPAQLMARLNQQLCEKRIESSFVTALLAFYEPAKRRFIYSAAGHPLPLLVSAENETPAALSAAGGPPLGIVDPVHFDQAWVDLDAGQSLLLYTDGISEAKAPLGEMFGEEGIVRAMRGWRGDSQGLIDSLCNAVKSHQRGRLPSDDQTLVAIHVRKES